jgi:formate-dependent nitrite reductase cytochrome c552 subunit
LSNWTGRPASFGFVAQTEVRIVAASNATATSAASSPLTAAAWPVRSPVGVRIIGADAEL